MKSLMLVLFLLLLMPSVADAWTGAGRHSGEQIVTDARLPKPYTVKIRFSFWGKKFRRPRVTTHFGGAEIPKRHRIRNVFTTCPKGMTPYVETFNIESEGERQVRCRTD